MRPRADDATVFTHFSGTLNIINGVARNDDLRIQGANLRAKGKDTANLPADKIDYRLLVTLAEGTSRKGTTVPVDIRGTFSEPQYNVALNEVLKAQAKKKIEKKFKDRFKEKLKKKLKLK